jgi:hypothetical protein
VSVFKKKKTESEKQERGCLHLDGARCPCEVVEMGSVLGLCSMASWIPCLCGSAPCLLCRCCPSGNNSTVTRLIYALFLLVGVCVACVMLIPGMEEQLNKVSFYSCLLMNWNYRICIKLIWGDWIEKNITR